MPPRTSVSTSDRSTPCTTTSEAIELALAAALRGRGPAPNPPAANRHRGERPIGLLVLGSDQGLVGRFNEAVVDLAATELARLRDESPNPGAEPVVAALGERCQARLDDAGLHPDAVFRVPVSVEAIAPLVEDTLVASRRWRPPGGYASFHVVHNRPLPGGLCEPATLRLIPLDAVWEGRLRRIRWPTKAHPQVIGGPASALPTLLREHLFATLFRVTLESLASENASRLAAMQRADKNIDELLTKLQASSSRLRQDAIDAELFDVVTGFEALNTEVTP